VREAVPPISTLTMTAPPSITAPQTNPTGIRIASTLCWVVGLITVVFAFALYAAPDDTTSGLVGLLVRLAAGVLVCAAGFLVRRRRKLGAYLVLAAWALPLVWALATHVPARGNFFLLVALVALLVNWQHLD
jgi:peptidoglycan/LPS O-acetylase OafA/YrhL